MSYRNRKLVSESFENVETTVPEIGAIDSDLSTAELDSHFSEADILIQDTELVEKLEDTVGEDEGQQETAILAVEAIASRWAICRRSLVRESLVPYREPSESSKSSSSGKSDNKTEKKGFKQFLISLWETFLDWMDSLAITIGKIVKGLTNAGKGLEKLADKQADKLKSLKSATAKKDKITIKGHGNVRLFYIDNDHDALNGRFDLTRVDQEVKKLESDVGNWVAGNLDATGDFIKVVVEEGEKVKRSREGGSFTDALRRAMKGASNRYDSIPNKPSDFFRATENKLKRMGPPGSKEEQVLFALPNNDYLQVFKYSHEMEEGQDKQEYAISGCRFISAHSEDVAADFKTPFGELPDKILAINLSTPNIANLISVNTAMKNLAGALIKVEREYDKTKREIANINKQARELLRLSKESEGLDRLSSRIANRVARETGMTTNNLYRFKTKLLGNTAKACGVYVAAGLTAYE